MPGTAHRIVDEQPFGKRAAVVRADGADREQLTAATDEEQRFALSVAEQHRAFGEGRQRHALREIGPFESSFVVAHLGFS